MLSRYLFPMCVSLCALISTSVLAETPLVGSSTTFLNNFSDFRVQQLNRQDPNVVDIPMGVVKGLSTNFTRSAGVFSLNLQTGEFKANFSGLDKGAFAVWFADQAATAPVSDLSQAKLFKVAAFRTNTGVAAISGTLNRSRLGDFAIDRVILASGSNSADDVLASGAMSVYQKILFGGLAGANIMVLQTSFSSLVPRILESTDTVVVRSTSSTTKATGSPVEVLIAQGERLFFDERFAGNGRTCGTCHPKERNFTIDPAFIATLPANDPLFVAEFNPALAQLERPQLMRQFGLILENVDGLEDPTNKFVMRSVPHTLGMAQSLNQDPTQPNPPAQMTGWSGDGAPASGSLRDFSIGAVTQHFPKSLNRTPGQDFVLPNNQQLDAMEAFQLSLGRTDDFDLSKITFLDAGVANGQDIFVNGTGDPNAGGRCNVCHNNAGAQVADGRNRNFNTNVEDVVNPARSVENFPIDGGFGKDDNGDGTFGNRRFNTPPVVEAADTPPFFHNNIVDTLEGVVEFYAGPEFNNPRGPGGRFAFTPSQVTDLANFMRGINTLQNIDIASRELSEILAMSGASDPQVQARLMSALLDSGDAVNVLNEGSLFPAAVTQLNSAQQSITQAQQTSNPNVRNTLISQAITALANAKNQVASIAP